ncbi:MAG TPA: 6-carboxytetrahydropterin synthase QueD [Acidimicrobiales bacterium]|jgi:6-pyruvoyltetrahydropterin/6-carboxytetrahydropterin synthase|nr:6-carboxytetrahydropterin synthase QueD [Acidimicrobiales bacterium]
MEIWKELGFESAHRLPNVPPDHKCARLHGHSFRVAVYVDGEPGAESGWIVDFADIDVACAPVIDALDHRYLNEIEGLGNPTSECIATWIWARVAPVLPGLSRVVVRETCTTGCEYRGPDR